MGWKMFVWVFEMKHHGWGLSGVDYLQGHHQSHHMGYVPSLTVHLFSMIACVAHRIMNCTA
jgi:hypothetical protein